ncbi:MAG: hypothetical protein WBW56_05615, partial [Syntrophobacteraceae bacterium]
MADTVIVIATQDEATAALQQLAGTFKSAGDDIMTGFGGNLQAVTGYMTQFLTVTAAAGAATGLYDLAVNWQNTVMQMQA